MPFLFYEKDNFLDIEFSSLPYAIVQVFAKRKSLRETVQYHRRS